MSDPLSIPGGVVGIISLGIQVCQGLVWYLQSFKGRDEEIQESLKEVQTLVSTFYSLKDVLTKIDKTSCETTAIRRCLQDSEEKLREVHKFSLKLRGPQDAAKSTREKIDNARRAMVYPFREEKLKTLRLSLQDLLQNLSLAVGLTSLRFVDLKKDISRTESFTQDFRQEVTGKLTLLSNDMGSIVSSNQRFEDAFNELITQREFQKKLLMSTLLHLQGMEGLAIDNPGSRLKTSSRRPSTPEDSPVSLPDCDCVREPKPWKVSYTFWNAKFEYEQHSFGQHSRSCKYFGIDPPTIRNFKAQLPLRLNWLSTRVMLTCIEYSLGTGNPGLSVRYKNVVPIFDSPVLTEIRNLQMNVEERSTWMSSQKIISAFAAAERAVLSLYRDGKASPSDRDEDGMCHVVLAYEVIQDTYIELHEGFIREGLSSFYSIRPALDMAAVKFMKTLVGLVGVDSGIIKNPESVYERPFGLTTLQACIQWPEGLQRLINTKAQDLIDEDLLLRAVKGDCIESVDILFKAGCPLDYGEIMDKMLFNPTSECMAVIASNLAQRRRDLLVLAQEKMGILQHLNASSNVADDHSASICRLLDNSKIPIPSRLRVPPSYSTIYHCYEIKPWHHPFFFKSGFSDLHLCNSIGLPPIMSQSHFFWRWDSRRQVSRVPSTIAWLESQGVMDRTPTDVLNLGLNTHATGWHYFASFATKQAETEVLKYTKNTGRDHCVCWCNTTPGGCSPLKASLKARVTKGGWDIPLSHHYFHRSMAEIESHGSNASDYCLELVRFLTFEALEMTHTCCEIKTVKSPNPSPKNFQVIMDCDKEKLQRIRSDQQEQQNAALLETLMQDFARCIENMITSKKALEVFILGYWRWRISELFTVDATFLSNLENCGVNVKTRCKVFLAKTLSSSN
ncbi:hypothetical protein F53441_13844 [Fusarium austroafricanum]|uniref:Azaphilone pigments biosynthesis cluster protein L N-terminal domain-containing protein n=1 Tax=Fusarium austroafricanum TaxID=2364996 RepID=A0A8H4NDQ7_9HYPO|nr:hypothetical protein F53441_13844 [Fusarium austroafricanum]